MNSLKDTILQIAARSPFYQKHLQHLNLSEMDFPSDLHKLPFTEKLDIFHHNEEFLAIPKHEVVDWVTTSGTLGDPVWFALSKKDLKRLAINEAGTYKLAGLEKGEIVLLTTTIDRRFMAGLAYYLGAGEHGISIIRNGPGIPQMQWDSIFQMKPSAIIAVPSFLLKLAEFARQNDIDLNTCSLKKAICIGENIRDENLKPNELAKRILEVWPNLKLFGTYASTEMSTAFTECEAGQGLHMQDELIHCEFLNENNEAVKPGELGELVITNLGVDAMPLLRFRTGDLMRHFTEPCSCGRKSLRIGPVEGRKQQMIKYRGTTLYPPALMNVLHESKEVDNFQLHLYTNSIGSDELHVWVSIKGEEEIVLNELKNRFRAKIRVSPHIIVQSFEEIEKSKWPEKTRKPILFIDHR